MIAVGDSSVLARGGGVRVGYFDCFSGIAGDMTMAAALVDVGVDPRIPSRRPSVVLGLPCELGFETVRRGRFRATTYARVVTPEEHAHRHWHHIEAIIDRGKLTDRQKDLARRVFLKLGEAEARVHGVDLSKIHFHEVGAVDSIVDIVGSCVGLDLLGVDRFEASPVPPGARVGSRRRSGECPCRRPATCGDPSWRPARRVDGRGGDDHPHRRGHPRDRRRAVPRPFHCDDDRIDRPGRPAPARSRDRRTSSGSSSGPWICRRRATGSGCSRPTSTIFPARSSATR